jgi:hypothetical protein
MQSILSILMQKCNTCLFQKFNLNYKIKTRINALNEPKAQKPFKTFKSRDEVREEG